MSVLDVAAALANNNSGEQQAIEGYYKLLDFTGLPTELYDDIKEIIADEMNHAKKLSLWITRLSGIKPAIT
jgi:rubrerythrin